MKTVSIIGPDGARVQAVAEELEQLTRPVAAPSREFHILVGAGPDSRPDCVLAVAGDPTTESLRVVRAVIGAMGVVVLFTDAHGTPWPDIPGALRVSTVDEAVTVIRSLRVDMKQWYADAHRADAERLDRVRIAVRLTGGRLAKECLANQDAETAHDEFITGLRRAVVRHGVQFPSVSLDSPELPAGQISPVSRLETWLPMAGALGAVAMGAGLGRTLGNVVAGLIVGVLIAAAVMLLRIKLQREHRARMHDGEVQQALQQRWMELVTQVVARLHIPRVAERIRQLENSGSGGVR